VTASQTDPSGRPTLLAATPSAERVGEWLRTLAILVGMVTLLVGLFAAELIGRL
jgi:hypothetical protein